MHGVGTLQHRGIGFEDREIGETIKGDTVKTQGEGKRKEGSNQTKREATREVMEPPLDQETIAGLAYYYWEARGCPHDSPHEAWFRAEAEVRNGLASPAAD
jgi:hypothetical protein